MQLYLVERTDNIDYDDYDSFVCWAKSEDEARWMVPDPEFHMWKDGVYCYSYREQAPVNTKYSNWVEDPKTLKIWELSRPPKEPTIVLKSFNAG